MLHFRSRDFKVWLMRCVFWVETRFERLVAKDDADSCNRKLLALRRCQNRTFSSDASQYVVPERLVQQDGTSVRSMLQL